MKFKLVVYVSKEIARSFSDTKLNNIEGQEAQERFLSWVQLYTGNLKSDCSIIPKDGPGEDELL